MRLKDTVIGLFRKQRTNKTKPANTQHTLAKSIVAAVKKAVAPKPTVNKAAKNVANVATKVAKPKKPSAETQAKLRKLRAITQGKKVISTKAPGTPKSSSVTNNISMIRKQHSAKLATAQRKTGAISKSQQSAFYAATKSIWNKPGIKAEDRDKVIMQAFGVNTVQGAMKKFYSDYADILEGDISTFDLAQVYSEIEYDAALLEALSARYATKR